MVWKHLAAAGLLAALTVCRAEERVSQDLVELFPRARVAHETGLLDFGSEAAREQLLAGFSVNEVAGDGSSFVWSEGDESEIRLFVSEPRSLFLTLRLWPFRFPGAPSQTLHLSLNGEPFADVELSPQPGEYRVELPVSCQIAGENRLEASYAYARSPSDVLPPALDGRRLAVAWDWLRVEGAVSPRAPAARGEGESASLELPAGSRVEYFVTAPERGRLAIDAVRSRGAGSLSVVVGDLSQRLERKIETPARRVEIPLPSAGEITRVAFQAGLSDLVLRRPVILTAARSRAEARPVKERRPNVIVYLIDTLRADHLSCYGYSKPTPRIDAFASDGTLFERARAQSSWTRPSTASILTGLQPRAHTANRRDDALPASVPTLAEALDNAGYETAALVANANVSAPFGFDRGFGTFELHLHPDGILGAPADRLVGRAIHWLDSRSPDRPFFLYLHTIDPHDPYGTTGFHGQGFGTVSFMESLEQGRLALTPKERERLIALYDQDVAFADTQFGRFVDALEQRGLYDDTLIVLLSDHGEEFGEHGRWRHGKTLYEELLDVPIIIKWPAEAGKIGAGRRVSGLVQHIDVVPTILDYLGVTSTTALPGASLWRLVAAGPSHQERAALSYLSVDGREVESVVVQDHKLIRYLSYDRKKAPYELFDLSHDRAEKRSVVALEKQPAKFLEAYLRYLKPVPAATGTRAVIEGEVERQLRALGYVR